MLGDDILDLGRIDVLAARDDHVLHPVDDIDEAVGIHVAAVAGMHPAAGERAFGFFRALPITHHDIVAAGDDLADGAERHGLVLGIDDAHLAAERRPPARPVAALGPALADMFMPVQERRDGRQLRHAVGLAELGGGQGGNRPVQHRFADRRGAVDDVVERRHVVPPLSSSEYMAAPLARWNIGAACR